MDRPDPMPMLTLHVDGLALWTPAAPGWAAAQAALRGATACETGRSGRPAPTLLAPNERRRAPDSVLVALEVASAAFDRSAHDPAAVASVFVSAHGDLPTTDAMCRTLAADPMLLSPTRFHHSVHNAASGYWAIGSGSHAASTALSAHESSFGAGLLEAASQCAADAAPVLLVGVDTEACGPLASVNRSRGLLGVALLLAPRASAASRGTLTLALRPGAAPAPAPQSDLARALADNAMADALPLFEALARGGPQALALRLAPDLHLAVDFAPAAPPVGSATAA